MFGRALPMRRRSSSNALMDAAAEAATTNLATVGTSGKYKSDSGLIGNAQPAGEYGPPSQIGNSANR